jgi:drug/metabolite transporter (DMT)-like permease
VSPARLKKRPLWYFLLLVASCAMFAGQGTAIKFLSRQLRPIHITFLPFYTGTLLMIPLLIRSRRSPNSVKLTWNDWRKFVVVGVIGQAATQFCYVSGVTRSLVSNAAILGLLLPVITALMASLMLRERITRLRMMALAGGLIGVLFLSTQSLKQSAFLNMKYLTGNVLVLVAVAGCAFYNVYCKSLFGRFQQIEILALTFITASIVSLPLVLWVDPFHLDAFRTFTWQTWTAFFYQGVIAYNVAMLVFFTALKHLDVTAASLSLYLIPVFGVTIAAVFLHERLSGIALCGTAFVFLSTLAIMKYDPGVDPDG